MRRPGTRCRDAEIPLLQWIVAKIIELQMRAIFIAEQLPAVMHHRVGNPVECCVRGLLQVNPTITEEVDGGAATDLPVGIEGLTPNTGRRFSDRVVDLGAGLLPTPEKCQEPVCRWLNGVFGLTHTHDQLNAATHETFPSAFGTGDVTTLGHLAVMTRKRKAVDHQGNDTYLPHVERLDLPLLFIQGSKNYIFKPKGLDKTIAWLQASHRNSADLHEVLMLDGYAHLDGLVGRNAATEVFPHIIDHLDRHS